ncbi:MAG: hypothetical protein NTU81_02730 [Candidatus Nomurabacteria bacterium]|nr:hypothetical protein [Candidatus Nomurabacteria bacterium]
MGRSKSKTDYIDFSFGKNNPTIAKLREQHDKARGHKREHLFNQIKSAIKKEKKEEDIRLRNEKRKRS